MRIEYRYDVSTAVSFQQWMEDNDFALLISVSTLKTAVEATEYTAEIGLRHGVELVEAGTGALPAFALAARGRTEKESILRLIALINENPLRVKQGVLETPVPRLEYKPPSVLSKMFGGHILEKTATTVGNIYETVKWEWSKDTSPLATGAHWNVNHTLGTLISDIKLLAQWMDPNTPVVFDFGPTTPRNTESYRGYYYDLAITYDYYDKAAENLKPTTVAAFCKLLERSLGNIFTGYKGGTYFMGQASNVWVSNYGQCSGRVIVGFVTPDKPLPQYPSDTLVLLTKVIEP